MLIGSAEGPRCSTCANPGTAQKRQQSCEFIGDPAAVVPRPGRPPSGEDFVEGGFVQRDACRERVGKAVRFARTSNVVQLEGLPASALYGTGKGRVAVKRDLEHFDDAFCRSALSSSCRTQAVQAGRFYSCPKVPLIDLAVVVRKSDE